MEDTKNTAVLYRMVMQDHICPWGIRAKDLLQQSGYHIEDHHLKSKAQTEAFKHKHGVKTTPQAFIDGERIGGYDDLVLHFGKTPHKDKSATSYQPVIAVFATSFLMALAVAWGFGKTIALSTVIPTFVAISMCNLAILKLRDLFSFANQFITYDLVGMHWLRYAYIYPFAEAFAGIGMLSGIVGPLVALVALVIGSIGTVSVVKAVYIDKRELKCACVGGDSNVPLGAISLSENLMMTAMGLWMLRSSLT
ncbi:MauE/DoxX family redox-associated membrane protein [Halioxenophilus aromaticivorans]|uniref:Methylamine utilization protein MauE n=1 Tax=Halioxenophilus aromaticivorans TaxID=1306992 RepID=A0AAV3U3F2_9ALTE